LPPSPYPPHADTHLCPCITFLTPTHSFLHPHFAPRVLPPISHTLSTIASLTDLEQETEHLLQHLHASAPSPPPPDDSTRSPHRKKRNSVYSPRNTSAITSPVQVIPQQFTPFSPVLPPLTMAHLLAYQSQCDRSPFLSASVPLILDTGASISIKNSPPRFCWFHQTYPKYNHPRHCPWHTRPWDGQGALHSTRHLWYST
jgi:hypothetical protein